MEHHFESICGSAFLNKKTIYSDYPDFTECFHNTILKWSPCLVLWLVAPFWTYMLTSKLEPGLKFSFISFLKLAITLSLVGIELFNLWQAARASAFMVFYLTPVILILTYILVLVFNHFERRRGFRTSTLLFVFWSTMILCSSLTLRSKIYAHINNTDPNELVDIYFFYAFFTLIALNLIISTFAEHTCHNYTSQLSHDHKTSPENTTPLLSRLTFLWIDPLIRKGFRRALNRDDMWDLDFAESSASVTGKLEKEWNKRVAQYVDEMNSNGTGDRELKQRATALYKTNLRNNEDQLILNGVSEMDVKVASSYKYDIKQPSLILCLCKVFGSKFVGGTFLKLAQDMLSFSAPLILDLIIKFIKDKKQQMIVGIFLTSLLFITTFIQSMLLQHHYFRMNLIGTRVRTALVNMIYKKSLRLSTTSRKTSTVGEMTNLVAVNAQLFLYILPFINMLWSSPLQILICIYMLWRYLGIAAFAGLATTVLFIPLNVFATDWNKKLSVKKLKSQDLRIKIINEILAGIKVIKFYGWELSFQKIVEKIRTDEMRYFTRNALVGMLSSFTWASAPFVVAATSYATFIFLNPDKNLDASTAFVSLTLFYLIRIPLALLPQTISLCVQGYVSLERIKRFLLLEETNDADIQHDGYSQNAILFTNVNLGWNKQDALIYNLNLEIKKEKLVAVVGKVGSGKSSLLAAISGEMHKLNEGLIQVNGSTAFVSQQAWIQNDTIKGNILFGREYNKKQYNKVVSACSLIADFNVMPAGDSTEIGEKGINLSGGQKQRISLARALYADADIYLLDDALSAVDAHIGKSIFEKVIGPNGMLKNKTRVFVTNSLSFLPQCDQIIMVDNGTVSETGNYEEMKNEDGPFADFIKLFLMNNETNKEQIKIIKNHHRDDTLTSNESTTSLHKTESLVISSRLSGSTMLNRQESQIGGLNLNESIIFPSGLKNTTDKIIDRETIESGTIKWSVLRQYVKNCGILNSTFFLVFFIVSNIALAASSLWLSAWSNEAVTTQQSLQSKHISLLIYVLIGLAQCIFLNVSNLFIVFMYIRAAKLFHKNLLASILRSTLHFFESTPTGRIINRFSKDIDSIETAIPDSFKIFMFCLMNIIHTFIILSYSTPVSLFLIVPISLLYIFIQRYFVSSSRQLARLDSATKSPIFSYFTETLTGVSTIRAYNKQQMFIKNMQKHIDENTIYIYIANCAERWLVLRLDLVANLIATLASLFAVFSRDKLSPGLVGLSISLSITVSQALNYFVKMGAEFETNITGVERIMEYFQIPHEAEWSVKDVKVPKSWPSEGKIVLKNYGCKYRKELDFVLKDINVEILPGEKIGIVGRTGAGKSSLSLGLFRLIEYSLGDIIIDNVNVDKIGLHDLRHKLTIIPQDPVIFSGSIKMNLDPFGMHSDDELWNALELAHLKDLIWNSDEKLEFKCSEGGENLSVGQRQLICLARALLRKTKILILDEATASIDHNTDELIQKTIRSQFSDCTVLTIAHRLNTIMDSSRIMVLDKGNIIEFDKPNVLLQNKSGHFYLMAKDADLI